MQAEHKADCDVIIIGSGPGGLSAAAALARAGRSVTVFERSQTYGGNCSAFKQGGYTFDLAVHQLVGGDGNEGYCSKLLDYYGVKENVQFFKLDPFVSIVTPEEEFEFPVTMEKFEQMLKTYFPDQNKPIGKFIKYMIELKQDMVISSNLLRKKRAIPLKNRRGIPISKKILLILRGLRRFNELSKTGEQLLSKHFKNKKIRALIGSGWPYLGLPPSKVSGLMLLGLVNALVYEGTYYPRGSSQAIADEMVNIIIKNGGKVSVGAAVRKIIIENGQAKGVELDSGKKIFANAIVSNADALETFTKFLDKYKLPKKYFKQMMRTDVSVGPFKLFLGLDYQVKDNGFKTHEYFFYESFDYDFCFKRLEQGYPSVVSAYSPTYINPELAPKGHSTLILTTFFPWKTQRDWREFKQEIADEMIAVAGKKVKNLSKHIRVNKIFTPDDLYDFSMSQKGAMYGWQNTPCKAIVNRLPQKTPIKNLFLSGHWTMPGSGVTTAIVSGWIVSREIIRSIKSQSQ